MPNESLLLKYRFGSGISGEPTILQGYRGKSNNTFFAVPGEKNFFDSIFRPDRLRKVIITPSRHSGQIRQLLRPRKIPNRSYSSLDNGKRESWGVFNFFRPPSSRRARWRKKALLSTKIEPFKLPEGDPDWNHLSICQLGGNKFWDIPLLSWRILCKCIVLNNKKNRYKILFIRLLTTMKLNLCKEKAILTALEYFMCRKNWIKEQYKVHKIEHSDRYIPFSKPSTVDENLLM